jgi:hypothetical protein
MSKIMDMISMRLEDRGLGPMEINRLVKDVANVIDKQKYITLDSVKRSMQGLGWEEHILDNHILELIFMFLDDEGNFDICRYFFH